MKNLEQKLIERPPVVVIMGHIDHGKSTLLDYIRKSHVVDTEAGGITQHVAAYEATHVFENKTRKITFLDTPGHEAFHSIRERGSKVADIAILVVSAEDGVKPQTIETLEVIKKNNTPYIVAITKIDKPGANIDRTKQSLAENEVLVEGWGGDVPSVPLSSKTGEGVNDLLDIILLQADMLELTGNPDIGATGIVIESNMDQKRGIRATLIIKDGQFEIGKFIATIGAFAPIRFIENFLGEQITKATFSSPVQVVGWSNMPAVGSEFKIFDTKKEAEEFAQKQDFNTFNLQETNLNSETELPIIIKTDTQGSLDAVIGELRKISNEKIGVRVISKGIGLVNETDIKNALTSKAMIIAFNVPADKNAGVLALREKVLIHTYKIIYELIDFMKRALLEATPKEKVEVISGKAKILKSFSTNKDKHVLGGRVDEGELKQGDLIKIIRREAHIGDGKVKELQKQKIKTGSVLEGQEFGVTLESKIEIVPGDYIFASSFITR